MDKELISLAKNLVKDGKVIYSNDAEKDVLKLNYTKDFMTSVKLSH